MASLITYQLSDFQVLKILGNGSYSKVKLVNRIADSKILALKQVFIDKLSLDQRDDAMNQIRILASIKSPFIVKYQGSFYSLLTNSLCLLMQYAQRGDLEEGLDQIFIWRTAINLLQGLRILHNNKIAHRDLKPANIFFSENGIAKIGDFNVSSISESNIYKTKTGTPYYTSPQIWKGEQYTTKCDIWSLGCILYQMCALLPPFKASSFPQLFLAVSRGQYKPLSKTYSDELRGFIRMFLNIDKNQRPTAQQLLQCPILIKKYVYFKQDLSLWSKVQLLKPLKCPRSPVAQVSPQQDIPNTLQRRLKKTQTIQTNFDQTNQLSKTTKLTEDSQGTQQALMESQIPTDKKTWTTSQIEQMFSLYKQYGSRWTVISKFIPGKPQNSIKNKFNCSIRKFTRRLNKINKQAHSQFRKQIRTQSVFRIIQATQLFPNMEDQMKLKSLQIRAQILLQAQKQDQTQYNKDIIQLIDDINGFNLKTRSHKNPKHKRRKQILNFETKQICFPNNCAEQRGSQIESKTICQTQELCVKVSGVKASNLAIADNMNSDNEEWSCSEDKQSSTTYLSTLNFDLSSS